jgi:serine/threonine-protein phosphatase 5
MSQPAAADADAVAMDPSPSPSPAAPHAPLPPAVVEWPEGGALTRDWVAGLASTLDWCSRHLPADRLPTVLPPALVQRLVLAAAAILHREPNLVRVDPRPGQSVVVVGDVHGQLHDVIFLLRDAGFPSEERVFVFNGDYVDRGAWGLETLLLLLAWKVLLPNCVFLLRGNHESKYCTSVYGFEKEVMTKYKDQGPQVYRKFLRCFEDLPLATIIAGCVYTAHGGIFRGTVVLPSKRSKKGKKGRKNKANFTVDPTCIRLGSLDELLKARRTVLDPPWEGQNLIPGDVLWSDPSLQMGLSPNQERGIGLLWGPDITQQFLRANNLKLIIRSHEGPDARDKRHDLLGMDKGYTIDHEVECGKLITLFSAPDYPQFQASEERYNNCGAYIVLDPPDFATPVFHSFEAVKPRPPAHPFYDFEEVIDSDEELNLDAMDSGTSIQ